MARMIAALARHRITDAEEHISHHTLWVGLGYAVTIVVVLLATATRLF